VTHGIPGIAYEVGDDTDRQALVDATGIFAMTLAETLSSSPS
jgi:hypothetical protein